MRLWEKLASLLSKLISNSYGEQFIDTGGVERACGLQSYNFRTSVVPGDSPGHTHRDLQDHGSIFVIMRNRKHDKCLSAEWINKMWHNYMQKYFTAAKSQELYPFQ